MAPSPLRITFVVPDDNLSGGMRVIGTYASELAKRGHDVTLATVPRPKPLRARLSAALRGKLRVSEGAHLSGLNVRRIRSDARKAERALPEADVVIATWWGTADAVAALSPSKGVKAFFLQGYEVAAVPHLEAELDATWRLPLHKIAVSEWVATIARERFGDPQVIVVPNGVDAELFRAPPRDKQPRPTAGFVYSPLAIKGPDLAVRALERARARVPDLEVVAFGATEPTPEYPLPPWVRFTFRPPQHTLRRIYASADVWLWPSRVEGFGLPILEAMACRTPVVATDAGAARELLRHGGGSVVPVDDVDALAEETRRIATLAPDDWRQLSDVALAASRRHEIGPAVERFEQALRTIVDRT